MAILILSPVIAWAVYPAKKLLTRLKKKANKDNVHSGEQDLELGNMDASEVRRRPGHNQVAAEPSSPTSTAGTLTPSSTEDSSQTEGSFLGKTWRQLSNTWSKTASGTSEEEQRGLDDIRGYNQIVYENVNDHTMGLGRLAAFTASDPDFGICRRFKWEFYYAIKELEIEIHRLGSKIRESAKEIAAQDESDPRLLTTCHEHPDPPLKFDTKYWDMSKELRLKLKEYSEMIQFNRHMEALPEASKRSYFAVFDWIWGEQELAPGYLDFIYHGDDFVYLSQNHLNPMEDKIMEYMCTPPTNRFKEFLKKRYMSKHDVKKTAKSPDRLSYYATSRFKKTSTALLVCLIISILLIPVFILFLVPMSRPLMAVTATVFIIPATFLVSFVTGAKVFELLVGASTFGAVLIMFLGNTVQQFGASG